VLVRSYTGDILDAAMDNLDNLYVVSSSGQVKKYDANGDSAGIYSQTRNFGKLFSIDVTNPLQPLLFYKDFSTVVLLDRFLTSRATIDLRRHQILQPGAAASSYDNKIWIFDEYDNKLKKIDEQGNKLLETPDFRSVFNEAVRPQKIINDNGLVFLTDTAHGIYIFDNYGSFKKRLPFTNWQSIAVRESYIIQTLNNGMSVYNSANFREVKKMFPSSFQPYVHSFYTGSKLVTYSKDSLAVYRFTF
jgi:hypothetical protein